MNEKYFIGNIYNKYDIKDKRKSNITYLNYMLNRVSRMFKYEGLPETIPQRVLDLYMYVNGYCGIDKAEDGNLYPFFGGLGGEPDVYYMPTLFTVANPALNMSKTYKIHEDCVIIPNDTMYMGLIPMFRRYASQLVENDITLRNLMINDRAMSVITTPNDIGKTSAEIFYKKLEDGDLTAVVNPQFTGIVDEKIEPQPLYTAQASNLIHAHIELHQYLKASWYNDLGLNANYNMKREAINSDESQLNFDALLPFVDDMLENRKRGVEEVNKIFGTDITVDIASAWKELREGDEDLIVEDGKETSESEDKENGNTVSTSTTD